MDHAVFAEHAANGRNLVTGVVFVCGALNIDWVRRFNRNLGCAASSLRPARRRYSPGRSAFGAGERERRHRTPIGHRELVDGGFRPFTLGLGPPGICARNLISPGFLRKLLRNTLARCSAVRMGRQIWSVRWWRSVTMPSVQRIRPRNTVVILRQTGSVSPVEGARGPPSARKEFRPDIEGLRAVAVLGVVLFHAEVPGVGGGYIGVDVFFVISGFLITGLLWREVSTAGTVRLGRFYGARARRLLPASATVGAITVIASAVLLPPLQARTVFGDGIASALYVGNYRFILQGVDYLVPFLPPSPFQHYWSLGVEEQFYFVWPPLIIGTAWLIRRVRRRNKAEATSSERPYLIVLALVAVVSFALSLATTYVVPSVAFFSLPTRAWQLAVGGLVALTAGHWRRLPATFAAIAGWAGLALILLSCTVLSTTTPYPGIAALWPVLGAALVIGAGCAAPAQGSGRVLALSPMRAIGRVSYSWYLWHWPVLLLAPPLLGHPLGLAGRLAAVVVSGGLAVLTLHLIENPLRFAAAVRRSPARSLALGGAATAVAVCVGVALLVWCPPRSAAAHRPSRSVSRHASPHGRQH